MSANVSKKGSEKRAWLLFLPLLLLYAASYFQRTAIPGTIFEQLAGAIGRGFVAALGPAFIWIYSASQLGIGVLIDRFSVKYVVLTGGAFFVLGVLIFPFVATPWAMYAARMSAGLGAGTLYLSLVREVDRLFGRKNYALMMGVVYVVGYGGGMLGTLPFGRVVHWANNDWRLVLLWIAVFSLICYLWFAAAYRKEKVADMLPSGGGSTAPPLPAALKKLFCSSRNWMAMMGGTINFAIYFTIQTVFGKKFLTDIPGFSEAGAESVIFVMTLVCMAVLFSSSLLSRVLDNRRKPLLYAAAMLEFITVGVMTATLHWQWNIWLYPVCFCCFAAASGMLIVYTMTAQELGCEAMMTQSAGLNNMINYFGAVALTLIASAYLENFSPEAASAYPPEAYKGLFSYLLVPAAAGVIFVRLLPETRGKFLDSL